ncbi:Arginine/serine-rich splicing factor scl25a transcript I [Orobanche gracilis]
MRGRSYTPSPPRGYGRRSRSPPRGRHGRGDAPTSLLVRNLRHDCRPEDLRRPFGQFGPIKDIYLPRDYYTGDPRGFGFVQYVDPADAADAKYQMDGQIFHGRELTVVFAEENRKRPTEMRARERGGSQAVFMIEGDHRHVILILPDIHGPPHHGMEDLGLIAVITTTLKREDTRGLYPQPREGTVERGRTHVHNHHMVQEAAARVWAEEILRVGHGARFAAEAGTLVPLSIRGKLGGPCLLALNDIC